MTGKEAHIPRRQGPMKVIFYMEFIVGQYLYHNASPLVYVSHDLLDFFAKGCKKEGLEVANENRSWERKLV